MSYSEIRLSPLMMAYKYLKTRGWDAEKVADSEISTEITDFFTPFHLCMMWQEDQQSLMVCCNIRHNIPEKNRSCVQDLLSSLNARIWMGHFEIAPEDDLVGYRYTLNLAGVDYPTSEQIESMVDIATSECVRIFPALQYILIDGKTATEAALAAMMETVGEA